jgi:hypothetical protein
MTVQETINTVRTLIDSGHEWYADFEMLENIINAAQIKILEAYVAKGEERIFRKLVVFEQDIDVNQAEVRTSFPIFQPRHCIIKVAPPGVGEIFVRQLSYLPPDKFFAGNYMNRYYLRMAIPIPRLCYWTYSNRWDVGTTQQYSAIQIINHNELAAFFIAGSAVLFLTYIRYPILFSLQTSQGLMLADECHLEVAAMAAEMINTIDVLEYERGLALPPESGARITLDKTGVIR